MIGIKFDISPGIDAVAAALRAEVQGGMDAGFEGVLQRAEEKAKELAPGRTGRLSEAISAFVTGRLTGALVSKAPYSSFLHEGTGIYGTHGERIVIEPRVKQALWWPGARYPVKKVEIKGVRPMPFLRQAISDALIRAAFDEGFERGQNSSPGR
jgi:hypothetical protein